MRKWMILGYPLFRLPRMAMGHIGPSTIRVVVHKLRHSSLESLDNKVLQPLKRFHGLARGGLKLRGFYPIAQMSSAMLSEATRSTKDGLSCRVARSKRVDMIVLFSDTGHGEIDAVATRWDVQ